MVVVTLDVVLLLPPTQRALAIRSSDELATSMAADGGAAFRLGADLPRGSDGPAEPHVSLFMLAVEDHEIPEVAVAVAAAARAVGAVQAVASEYRHNGEGAPEVFFDRSDEFRAVQRAVIETVEPLRRGRLREFGPGGETLAAIVAEPDPADPARVRQLLRYGFDDVSDDADDRFAPHVTLSWPHDETTRTDLSILPPVGHFSARLTDVALYGMGPHGTCTRRHGSWTLTGASVAEPAPSSSQRTDRR